MDPYLEPYWDLDQVLAWAGTRDANVVRFAMPAGGQATRAIAATVVKAARLEERGRDIDRELWRASGWDRERHRKVAYQSPFPSEGHDAARDREPHGPPQELGFYPFPTEEYVLFLLREGRLTASGSLPSEVLGRQISSVEWRGLELSIDPSHSRVGVFKLNSKSRSSAPKQRSVVFENVRIPRDEILGLFPADPPKVEHSTKSNVSDESVLALIRAAICRSENDGFVSQEKGAEIVRKTYPNFDKKRAMSLVKRLTGNTKPGPRGPRKKRAENSA